MGWVSGKRYLFNAIKYLSPLIHVGKMPQKQLPLKAVAPFRQRKKLHMPLMLPVNVL